ncbi:MAG: phosphoribosylformylglycinamidine synthase [Selenomonadaceae bacterium]|nr:phosphoribosylformylglycinamidine synthase [Selenomonadaceae bacterium]
MGVRRIFVEKRQGFFDVPARKLSDDLTETFRLTELKAVRLINRYDIEGLSAEEYAAVKWVVFAEPPVDIIYEEKLPDFPNSQVFAIEYLPGQYDQRADSAAQCVQLVTQKERPLIRVAQVIVLVGNIPAEIIPRIKTYLINAVECREAALTKPESLAMPMEEPPDVEVLRNFLSLDDTGLAQMMAERGLAMNLADLSFCQRYFRDKLRRSPTITELRVIDTYWSDHCRHTTFTTAIDKITVEEGALRPVIEDAFLRYLALRQEVYGENTNREITLMDMATIGTKALKKAGFIPDLDESEEINACSIKVKAQVGEGEEDWLVMFKNETHNHPTEIEPFGGAATCLGGAIRDPLSGRSYVYQAMRVTGAADPRTPLKDTLAGKLPQKKITLGAAAGYSSYGNQIGLATGQVREIYHPGYVAKRLEIGAVIGAAPAKNVVRERPVPGDIVILVGGRTGRDGCGGATGSSKEHTADSLTTCGAEVQKGNPPTERKLQRLFRNPEVSRLIKRCNDFGAGGVAVAIGELAPGLLIDLDSVSKKYEGLDGTELAISESQERMAVVVAPKDIYDFIEAAAAENLEATQVAVVTEEPQLVMKWRGQDVVRLDREFLDTNGVRQHVTAKISLPQDEINFLQQLPPKVAACGDDLEKAWLENLKDLNVADQKGLAERFDSTIGAGTVLMPFGGKKQLTPTDGMVAKLPVTQGETDTATAMTFGFNPFLSEWSPFHGAIYAVVESLTKLAVLGADATKARLTFQEYFPHLGDEPQKWGQPTAALLGALTAQAALKIPAIGGKDSMSGTFMDKEVPPTLVSFAVAVMNGSAAVSPEFKYPGQPVVILPCPKDANGIPDFVAFRQNLQKVSELIAKRQVLAAQSVGFGGVAAAVTKMCLGNGIGFTFGKDFPRGGLFLPDYGTMLLEVAAGFNVETALAGTDAFVLGETTENGTIVFGKAAIALWEAEEAYTKPLSKIFPSKLKQNRLETASKVSYTRGSRLIPWSKKPQPRVFIPVFPGTNCEYDSERVWRKAGADVHTLIIKNLTPAAVEETVAAIAKELREAQIMMLPGGFSGGDEPDGSGKFIAAMFRNPLIKEETMNLIDRHDGLILGICNGFQALVKLGLLPYGEIRDLSEGSPTLTHNNIGRHVSCMVRTKIVSNLSPWFSNVNVGDIHTIAVSHGEGRFVADHEIMARMRVQGQIATQYVDKNGLPTMNFPDNPNGSQHAIEGITSPNGRVLGKMGHSERIGTDIGKNIPGSKDQELFAAGVNYYS